MMILIAPFLPVLGDGSAVRRNALYPNDPLLSEILIEVDVGQQSQLVSLIIRYRHIFSNTLESEPAKIPPSDLVVDKVQWESP